MSENTQNEKTILDQIFDAKESRLECSIKKILQDRKIKTLKDELLLNAMLLSKSAFIYSINSDDAVSSNKISQYFYNNIGIMFTNTKYVFIEAENEIFLVGESFIQVFEQYKKSVYENRKESFLKSIGLE